MGTVVDIHCHTFNADDLPVRGFIGRTQFSDSRLGDLIARLADKLVDGAPGFEEENARLDALLEDEEAFVPAGVAELEVETEANLARLQVEDPELVREVGKAMVASEAGDEEGVGDWIEAAKRAIRWVTMFKSSRLANTVTMIQNFGDRIDLFTPMTVDLELGLHDTVETTVAQQVVLHEKISRLSMLGRLPDVDRARVHPFIGFDPRREVRDQRAGTRPSALEIVKAAVLESGFVGVKLYPPMGFLPIGNTEHREMTAEEAVQVDSVLRELYGWCVREDVPITAHCSSGIVVHQDFANFPAPEHWKRVLAEFPGLRVNLGHFGGDSAQAGGWPWQIAELATDTNPFLSADVGDHRIHDSGIRDGYFAMLKEIFTGPGTGGMAKRFMFGTDWYMIAIHPQYDRFLDNYQTACDQHLDAAQRESFFSGAALSFLGFDKDSGNSRRLLKRYADVGVTPPAWLAGAVIAGPADLVGPRP